MEQDIVAIVRFWERLLHVILTGTGFVFVLGVAAIWAFVPWLGQMEMLGAAVGATFAWLVVCGLASNGLVHLVVRQAVWRFRCRYPERGGDRNAALACLARVRSPRQLANRMLIVLGAPVGTLSAPEDQVAAALAPQAPVPLPAAAPPRTSLPERDCIPLEPRGQAEAPVATPPATGRFVFVPLEPRDDGKQA